MVDIGRLRFPKSVSDIVDLDAHFQSYSYLLNEIVPKVRNKTLNHFTQSLGLTTKEYEEIKTKFKQNKHSWKIVQVNKLHVPINGFHPEFNLHNIPNNSKLKTLECLKRNFKKEKQSRIQLVRYRGQVNCNFPEETNLGVMKDNLRSYKDYLICVRIYDPGEHFAFVPSHRSSRLAVSQEFLVYGSSGLCSLRDRISCEEDICPAEGDVSENPFLPTKITNQNVFRSSMFFINDIFYVDGRHPGNIDYSYEVKEWAKRKKLPYSDCVTEKMENTKFNSIRFRLGYPYLFQHQGNCEHLIIFTDARLLNQSDILSKIAYPLMKSYASIRGKRCGLCAKKLPKFIVVGMNSLPNIKSYLCPNCLYSFCYNEEGKKISDFSVFKYVDRVAVL